jgi:hypothetical protein
MKYSLKQIIKRTDKYLSKNCLKYKRAIRKYEKENVSIEWTFIDNYECQNDKPNEKFLIQYTIDVVNLEKRYNSQNNLKCRYCGYECDCIDIIPIHTDTEWIYFKSDLGYKR